MLALSMSDMATVLSKSLMCRWFLAMPASWFAGCVGEVCDMLTQSVRSKPITV